MKALSLHCFTNKRRPLCESWRQLFERPSANRRSHLEREARKNPAGDDWDWLATRPLSYPCYKLYCTKMAKRACSYRSASNCRCRAGEETFAEDKSLPFLILIWVALYSRTFDTPKNGNHKILSLYFFVDGRKTYKLCSWHSQIWCTVRKLYAFQNFQKIEKAIFLIYKIPIGIFISCQIHFEIIIMKLFD